MERSKNIYAPERRFYGFEAKADNKDGQALRISGSGAVFGQYANMGWYVEKIEPGFLSEARTESCACLFNHSANKVLGRMKSGTMGIDITSNELGYWANLPKSREDVYEIIQRGDVYQSSFAFITKKARWEQLVPDDLKDIFQDWEIERLTYGGKIDLRILESAHELIDVSPVTYPAYNDTSVSSKGSEMVKEERDAFRSSIKIFPVNIPNFSKDWNEYIEACKVALD